MVRALGIMLGILISGNVFSQTCTIVDPDSNPLTNTNVVWNPLTSPTCQEGGRTTANSTTLIIPKGVQLEFDNVSDTWTGTVIEVYGELLIDKADVVIYANLRVRNGGLITINKKLSLGNSPTDPTACNFNVIIDGGGKIDVTTTGTDRLNICGSPIMKGAGSCNTCGGTNSGTCAYIPNTPYCEPTGGFTGPLGYSKDGFDASLPVELISFNAYKRNAKISLSWATSSELNFDYFDIEKSSDGKNFYSIAKVKGFGTTNLRQDYALDDEKPLIGKNYYRLKSIDYDGYTEYFTVVMVEFDGSKGFSIFPNPSEGVSFTAETNFTPQSRAFVVIYTTLGAEVGRYEVSGSNFVLTMPAKLESGVYYAKYISNDFTATNRILVK